MPNRPQEDHCTMQFNDFVALLVKERNALAEQVKNLRAALQDAADLGHGQFLPLLARIRTWEKALK